MKMFKMFFNSKTNIFFLPTREVFFNIFFQHQRQNFSSLASRGGFSQTQDTIIFIPIKRNACPKTSPTNYPLQTTHLQTTHPKLPTYKLPTPNYPPTNYPPQATKLQTTQSISMKPHPPGPNRCHDYKV